MKTAVFLAITVAAFATSARAQSRGAWVLAKTIPLLEVPGEFNHISSDVARGRVFVTATTRKTVEIVDVKSGKSMHSLTGDGPGAALFAPEFNQLYVTRGQQVCLYDGDNFELKTRVELPSSLDELGCRLVFYPGVPQRGTKTR